MNSPEWKKEYPYTLDKSLREAMETAQQAGDDETVKKIWEIFTSYRKSVVAK